MKSVAENPIRKKILDLRKSLSADDVKRLSQEICHRFWEKAQDQFSIDSNLVVGLYRSFQSELDLSMLEGEFQKKGAILAYPRISAVDQKQIEFVEVGANSDLSWKISPYGFHEPHPELPTLDPKRLNLIFVPGVAFGESGERIGRGAGHYDRFLSQAPQALRIALAYDFQVLHELRQNEWDQPVHWIMTELREFRALKKS